MFRFVRQNCGNRLEPNAMIVRGCHLKYICTLFVKHFWGKMSDLLSIGSWIMPSKRTFMYWSIKYLLVKIIN